MGTTYEVLLVRKFSHKVLNSGLTESNARCICAVLRKLDRKSKFIYSFQKEKR